MSHTHTPAKPNEKKHAASPDGFTTRDLAESPCLSISSGRMLLYTTRTSMTNPFTIKSIFGFLRRTFISGPKLLFTTRLSGWNAFLMILLCAPAIFFTALLTVPALIFQSPQQHAYYYFAQMLNEDPTRWIIFTLAGICAVLALGVPANVPSQFTAGRK